MTEKDQMFCGGNQLLQIRGNLRPIHIQKKQYLLTFSSANNETEEDVTKRAEMEWFEG